jgi:spore coat protein SA
MKTIPLLQQFKPEVVHFHGLPFGAFLTRAVRARKVLTFDFFEFRGSRNPVGRMLYRRFLERFDRLVAVSEYCRQAFSVYWTLAEGEIDVVYNGVNTYQFRPNNENGVQMRRRIGMDGRRVLLYVGRVCEQKGTDLLLDAWVDVRRRFSDTELVIAGPPSQFGNTESTSLTARIDKEGGRYLGAIDEHELADLYNACHIFIMPTRRAEMFGMAAVEAQACGKPVIASRIGGLLEALSNDSALFFSPNDDVGLSDGIVRLLGDRELISRLAAQAVTSASRFAWNSIADRTRTVYETALGEP